MFGMNHSKMEWLADWLSLGVGWPELFLDADGSRADRSYPRACRIASEPRNCRLSFSSVSESARESMTCRHRARYSAARLLSRTRIAKILECTDGPWPETAS